VLFTSIHSTKATASAAEDDRSATYVERGAGAFMATLSAARAVARFGRGLPKSQSTRRLV